MNFRQLELELNLALEDAAATPALADLQRLWAQIEPALEQLPISNYAKLITKSCPKPHSISSTCSLNLCQLL